MEKNPPDYLDRPCRVLNTRNPALILEVAELTTGKTQRKLLRRAHYLAGYAHYLLYGQTRKHRHLKKALRHFKKAHALHPTDPYAAAHLTYAAFEAGKYRLSLQTAKTLPYGQFAAQNQHWRDLNLEQIKICCRIRLGKTRRLEKHLNRHLANIARSWKTDLPFPSELTQTLRALALKAV
jgi:hypothetical protein